MAEISKDSKFTLSLELIVILGCVIVTTAGMWFTLQAEIEEAKKLPSSEISRTEYDLKDQLIRETIMNTQTKVEQNNNKLDDIDEKLYELIKSK
jgi:plasmid maintenance system antidote protein VapI